MTKPTEYIFKCPVCQHETSDLDKLCEHQIEEDRKINEENKKRAEEQIYNSYVRPYLDSVPRKFRSATFDTQIANPAQKIMWEKIQATINDEKGFYIHGSVGAGKTMLATMCGNHLARQSKRVRFKNLTSLLVEIQMSYNSGRHIDYEDYLYFEILILDDMGKERLTEWSGQIIYDIINTRTENLRRTIITSNFSPSQLIAKLGDNYGQAIVSRLYESCLFYELTTPDYRLNGGTK